MVIIQKKSSGTWWKCLLSFLGGFIFAFVAVAGGLAVVGTQVNMGDMLNLIGPNVADTVLTVEYQQKTAFDVVMSFVNKEVDYTTLGGLSEVTPLIDTYLGKINDAVKDKTGVEINIDEIKAKPYAEIPQYIVDTFKNQAKLYKLLGVNESSDDIMKVFCYERDEDGNFVYDKAYTVADFLNDDKFIENKMDSIILKDIVGENPDSKVLDSLKNKTLKELKEDDVFGELLVSEVIEITDSSPKILKTFRDKGTKVKEMSDAIDDLYLSDVYETDDFDSLPPAMQKLLGNEAAPKQPVGGLVTINYEDFEEVIFSHTTNKTSEEYKATDYIQIESFFNAEYIEIQQSGDSYVVVNHGTYDRSDLLNRVFDIQVVAPTGWDLYATLCNKPTKVKDLDSSIDSLKLKDVVQIEPDSPLYKIRHTPINDADGLFDAMKKNLTIKDIFGDDIGNYKFINAIPENTTIEGIGDAINGMKLIKAFEDNIYNESGNLTSMWKYLLIEAGETWIEGNPHKSTEPFATYKSNEYTVGGRDGAAGTPEDPKGINQMMENMKYWMEHQKLKTMQNDGMITVTGNLLTTAIPAPVIHYNSISSHPVDLGDAVDYGDLNTRQFVELMTNILPYIS